VTDAQPKLIGPATGPCAAFPKRAIIRVGDGRGFVVRDARGNYFVITAAHCLPHLPPAHAVAQYYERTYGRLLGRLVVGFTYRPSAASSIPLQT
jgi:hypothetical protein